VTGRSCYIHHHWQHSLPNKILPDFSWITPSGFHFIGFRNNNFLQSKLVSLASNPQPVFRSPFDRVAQLYPRTGDFLFSAFYDSQGYGGITIPRFHLRSRGILQELFRNSLGRESESLRACVWPVFQTGSFWAGQMFLPLPQQSPSSYTSTWPQHSHPAINWPVSRCSRMQMFLADAVSGGTYKPGDRRFTGLLL
jgi:hypothetical protein